MSSPTASTELSSTKFLFECVFCIHKFLQIPQDFWQYLCGHGLSQYSFPPFLIFLAHTPSFLAVSTHVSTTGFSVVVVVVVSLTLQIPQDFWHLLFAHGFLQIFVFPIFSIVLAHDSFLSTHVFTTGFSVVVVVVVSITLQIPQDFWHLLFAHGFLQVFVFPSFSIVLPQSSSSSTHVFTIGFSVVVVVV